MTALEVLEAAAAVGATLVLDDEQQLTVEVDNPETRLPPAVREGLKVHKDRLRAVLKLRAIHTAMGFATDDVLFIEKALLSGRVAEIRVATLPPRAVA